MKIQKGPQTAKAILRKKDGGRKIKLSEFRLQLLRQYGMIFKATVIETVLYWHKNRNTDHWSKTESPEINPHTYEHLILDKGGKNIQWRKESLFNKWC